MGYHTDARAKNYIEEKRKRRGGVPGGDREERSSNMGKEKRKVTGASRS